MEDNTTVKKETIRERKIKHLNFVAKYHSLCELAFTYYKVHGDWKQVHTRQLVELARTEIGFSKNTASTDICYRLFRAYTDNEKHKQGITG